MLFSFLKALRIYSLEYIRFTLNSDSFEPLLCISSRTFTKIRANFD